MHCRSWQVGWGFRPWTSSSKAGGERSSLTASSIWLGIDVKVSAAFPGMVLNRLPAPSEIEHLFREGYPSHWIEDAIINIYLDGQESRSLSIIASVESGFWLWYRIASGASGEVNAISCGSRSELNEQVPLGEDTLTLRGLFIEPSMAFNAVSDFISSEGQKSHRIDWITPDEIPEGHHWLISEDCV